MLSRRELARFFTCGKHGKLRLETVNSRPNSSVMIVRALSDVACTTGFIHRCLAWCAPEAARLTAENRLARLDVSRDVLQRAGVLSVRGKRHLTPLDVTRVVFSCEKFFSWNDTGPIRNRPIVWRGAHGRPPPKTDLDPDTLVNEHSQRNPGNKHGGRRDREKSVAILA